MNFHGEAGLPPVSPDVAAIPDPRAGVEVGLGLALIDGDGIAVAAVLLSLLIEVTAVLVVILMALVALGLSGAPFHEPFHAEAPLVRSFCYCA